jgi:hypothetical protein
MPKRTDLQSILVLGSGPIVIGQACEFDYSGTQACRVLRAEGYRVVLVNSNPATIMTDPEYADATYVEPLTPDFVEKIIAAERPDAVLPTVGGQTGINLALALAERGALERYGVELLGAGIEALRLGESRQLFKEAMEEIGLKVPRSAVVSGLDAGLQAAQELGFPLIVRPSYTLGGEGGGTAYNRDELEAVVAAALLASPAHEALLEQSVLGWKEFELEQLQAHYGLAALDNRERLRPTLRGFKVANAPLFARVRAAMQRITELENQRATIPARVPVQEIVEADVVKLSVERKHLTDILKMVAYQAEGDLLRLLSPHYCRTEQEGRTLIHSALAAGGDIEVTTAELLVSLDPLSSPHKTQALATVCEQLNATVTLFPGTKLQMRFAMKPEPPRSLAFPGPREPSGGAQPDISEWG